MTNIFAWTAGLALFYAISVLVVLRVIVDGWKKRNAHAFRNGLSALAYLVVVGGVVFFFVQRRLYFLATGQMEPGTGTQILVGNFIALVTIAIGPVVAKVTRRFDGGNGCGS